MFFNHNKIIMIIIRTIIIIMIIMTIIIKIIIILFIIYKDSFVFVLQSLFALVHLRNSILL